MTENIIATGYPMVLPRRKFLKVLDAALNVQSLRFARQAALNWLAVFPGDMQVNLYLGRALFADGKAAQAADIARGLTVLDPQYLDAYRLMFQASPKGCEDAMMAKACMFALGDNVPEGDTLPNWSLLLRSGWQSVTQGQLDEGEKLIHQALGEAPEQVLGAVLHLMVTFHRDEPQTTFRLAALYHSRWPECLQFRLGLADMQTELGDEAQAVNLLHECVSQDSAGQVPARFWGMNHHYRPLWPEGMEVRFELAIPVDVAVYLGWNRLAAGSMTGEVGETGVEVNGPGGLAAAAVTETAALEPVVEAVAQAAQVPLEPAPAAPTAQASKGTPVKRNIPAAKESAQASVEEVFEKFAKKIKQPGLAKADGRFPMYVLFSSRTGLEQKYGQQTTTVINRELERLAEVIRRRSGWGALVFYPDDAACTALLGLSKVESPDPWKLKLSLADLDKTLARKGERIGAVIIVGNGDVVPFHQLPNPTDDGDPQVLSDNPYATLDSNYFIPEWPVGRLPGESGEDSGLLLEQIRNLVRYHTAFNQQDNWWRRLFFNVNPLRQVQKVLHPGAWFRSRISLGYTASVWKNASMAVYKRIGESQSLLASPPVVSGTLKPEKITNSLLGYYNLHGLSDSENWYGQREMSDPNGGPDYPVALTPRDLVKNGHAPQVVFSEACYGGYIQKKNEAQSIALKFIGIGTLAVVASTGIAYGSVNTPLIGADLLGSLFWNYLGEGYTVGEALMQAKVELAKEMNRRQGYLDGEDQKTLISFVLFGDPLVGSDAYFTHSKGMVRAKSVPAYKTVTDRGENEIAPQRIPSEIIREVKSLVEPYLPGLDEAEVRIARERRVVDKGGTGGTTMGEANGRTVVTISKQVEVAQFTHRHYARVTLDQKGKMVKLALSR